MTEELFKFIKDHGVDHLSQSIDILYHTYKHDDRFSDSLFKKALKKAIQDRENDSLFFVILINTTANLMYKPRNLHIYSN